MTSTLRNLPRRHDQDRVVEAVRCRLNGNLARLPLAAHYQQCAALVDAALIGLQICRGQAQRQRADSLDKKTIWARWIDANGFEFYLPQCRCQWRAHDAILVQSR